MLISPTIFTFSLIPNHSYGYKDNTYSPVMSFVPVLVWFIVFILLYVRMGKNRKDIDRTKLFAIIYKITQKGVSENEIGSIFSMLSSL